MSIDLDQPRSVGRILRSSLAVYGRYPALFLVLALGIVAPFDLAVLAITGRGPLGHFSSSSVLPIYDVVTFTFLSPLISALHVHAVKRIGEARSPSLAKVAVRGVRALPAVTATEVIANIGISLGFAALALPGFALSIMWSVAGQAAAVERAGWLRALRSSRQLARTHWVHVFVLQLVVGVVFAAGLLGARALPVGASTGALSVTVGIAVRTAIWSVTALTGALLYFDLQARQAAPARSTSREYAHLQDLDA